MGVYQACGLISELGREPHHDGRIIAGTVLKATEQISTTAESILVSVCPTPKERTRVERLDNGLAAEKRDVHYGRTAGYQTGEGSVSNCAE